jgi:hypothetical protein
MGPDPVDQAGYFLWQIYPKNPLPHTQATCVSEVPTAVVERNLPEFNRYRGFHQPGMD